MKFDKNLLAKITKSLREYDPRIVEIIQFGSSVYSPKHARDLDLLVFTKRKKEDNKYLDEVLKLNLPYDVDVISHEIGKEFRNSQLIISAFASHRLLYGDGKYLRKAFEKTDPRIEDAYKVLKAAKRYLEDAKEERDEGVRDWHVRHAFDGLFDAARIASMVYLATENTRWGRMKSRLPKDLREEFDRLTEILHIDYFYHGNYPKDYDTEFDKLYKRTRRYINKLK